MKTFLDSRAGRNVSFSEARELGAVAVPALTSALRNSAYEESWAGIVMALGFIGDASARASLVSFLSERPAGEVSQPVLQAAILVPVALGHIARGGDAESLRILQQLSDPQESPANDFRWSYKRYAGRDLAILIAESAINGIGVIGSPVAGEFLEGLKTRKSAWQDELADNIDEALRMNDRLQKEPAEKVFGDMSDMEPGASVDATKSAAPVAPSAAHVHSLTVVRHVDVTFANATADARLQVATDVLKVKDGPCSDEVACDVTMSRSGNVSTFGTAGDKLDIVSSDAELQTVFAITGNFKVIDTVGFCNGKAANWAGCGKTGSKSSIVGTGTKGDVWAHEFGHNVGLGHRNTCDQNIMHETKPATNSVNTTECTAYQ